MYEPPHNCFNKNIANGSFGGGESGRGRERGHSWSDKRGSWRKDSRSFTHRASSLYNYAVFVTLFKLFIVLSLHTLFSEPWVPAVFCYAVPDFEGLFLLCQLSAPSISVASLIPRPSYGQLGTGL